MGGVQRVFEILDTKPSVHDAPNAIALPISKGKINFKNVSFSYEDNAPVIQGVSLDVQPGEILALVGPSGAGKSTIFNLIPRFYDPTDGTIQIDGCDLRSISQESSARSNGNRAAGDALVRRNDPRKYPLWSTGCQ